MSFEQRLKSYSDSTAKFDNFRLVCHTLHFQIPYFLIPYFVFTFALVLVYVVVIIVVFGLLLFVVINSPKFDTNQIIDNHFHFRISQIKHY